MKKQVLTGVMTLSLLLGATTGAMAGEAPTDATKAVPLTAALLGEKMDDLKMEDFKPLTAESYAAEIAKFKANSAQMLSEGMTQAEIDQVLADMEKTLADIKSGKVQAIMAVSTVSASTAVDGGTEIAGGSESTKAMTLTLAMEGEMDKALTVKMDKIGGEADSNQATRIVEFVKAVPFTELTTGEDQKMAEVTNINLTVKGMNKSIADFKANSAQMLSEGITQAEIDETLVAMEQILADLQAGKTEGFAAIKLISATEAAGDQVVMPLTKLDKATK